VTAEASLSFRDRKRLEFTLIFERLRKGEGDYAQIQAFREWEWRRCSESPEYFIDNYGWLWDKGNGTISRWVMWPIQRHLLREWHAGYSMVAVKARQLGITTLQIHYFLWRTIFSEAAQSYECADSEEKAKEAMKRLRVTLDRVPEWMRERAMTRSKQSLDRKRDKMSAKKTVSFGFSELQVLTSTPNSVAGVSGAVGLDEFGRHREQEGVLNNALPSVEGGGQMFIIGNGNGEDELYFTYSKARAGDLPGFKAYFFWWGDDPRRLKDATITQEDGTEVPVEDFSRDEIMFAAAQGRLNAPWRERQLQLFLRKNPEADIWAFRVQYPCTEEEAFFLSGNSFFDLDIINGVLKPSIHKMNRVNRPVVGNLTPDEKEYRGFCVVRSSARGKLRMYEPPRAGEHYVVSVDPTGGSPDGDFAVVMAGRVLRAGEHEKRALEYGLDALERFEPSNLGCEAVCIYQARSGTDITSLIAERMANWYNEAILIIERNNHGGTIIKTVKETYFNLWYDRNTKKLVDDPSDLIGYQENKATKTILCDTLKAWVNKGWFITPDSKTVTEFAHFEEQESGRLTHPKGLHDDLVIASGLLVIGAQEYIHREREVRAHIIDPLTGLPME